MTEGLSKLWELRKNNPEEYERRMKAALGEDYYNEQKARSQKTENNREQRDELARLLGWTELRYLKYSGFEGKPPGKRRKSDVQKVPDWWYNEKACWELWDDFIEEDSNLVIDIHGTEKGWECAVSRHLEKEGGTLNQYLGTSMANQETRAVAMQQAFLEYMRKKAKDGTVR